ncbi:MAG: hypothetical protein KBG28_15240 [Kofleriaceae bacterium]|nr:hypothetical protein [Kofleriaceae bacterium]
MAKFVSTKTVLSAWILAAAACGGNGGNGGGGDAGGGGGDGGGGSSADAMPWFDAAPRLLTIEPLAPVIDATGVPVTLPFTARVDGQPVTATWTVADVVVGTINQTGGFRARGDVAGQVEVSATYGSTTVSTMVTVRVNIVDPGPISTADQDLLRGGGTADPAFAWLFPYEATVFPRGLAAPFMQYGGGATDALRITAQVGDFQYEGFVGATARPGATLPPAIWDALTTSAGSGQTVTLTATKLAGGQVTGPVTRTARIAQGDLKGIIYYNSYNSPLAGGGGVLRVKPGGNAEVVQAGCTVCHSVSAQGNVMVSGVSWSSSNPIDSRSFDLGADGSSTTRLTNTDGRMWSFAALTPNGALALSNGIPASGSPIRGLSGTFRSRLYDTATGLEVAAPSFTDAVQYALTPAFAPAGDKVAFTWHQGNSRNLAVSSVDLTQAPPVFGPPAIAVTVGSGIVGWPSFLPDSGAVVYQAGTAFDTEHGNTAELRLVALGATPAQNLFSTLPAANGRDGAGASILPGGEDEDNNRSYEATVLPIPVGGYYWIMFTSRRTYGHTLAPGGTVANTSDEFVENSKRKKLWVAAIDLDYATKMAAGQDPSHPAFYLPGQELGAGNMRAYAAMEPCRDLGATCESGADCCGGFCRPVDFTPEGEPVLACVDQPAGCSNTDETCATDGDCCGVLEGTTCINNRCAERTPIE